MRPVYVLRMKPVAQLLGTSSALPCAAMSVVRIVARLMVVRVASIQVLLKRHVRTVSVLKIRVAVIRLGDLIAWNCAISVAVSASPADVVSASYRVAMRASARIVCARMTRRAAMWPGMLHVLSNVPPVVRIAAQADVNPVLYPGVTTVLVKRPFALKIHLVAIPPGTSVVRYCALNPVRIVETQGVSHQSLQVVMDACAKRVCAIRTPVAAVPMANGQQHAPNCVWPVGNPARRMGVQPLLLRVVMVAHVKHVSVKRIHYAAVRSGMKAA